MIELIMVCTPRYHLVSNPYRVVNIIFGYFQVSVGAQNRRQNSSYRLPRTIEVPKSIGYLIFDLWTKSQAAPSGRFCMSNTIEILCIGWRYCWKNISIFRSPIYRWSMKLIFGGFEEDMSTNHPPNMKVKLAIEME